MAQLFVGGFRDFARFLPNYRIAWKFRLTAKNAQKYDGGSRGGSRIILLFIPFLFLASLSVFYHSKTRAIETRTKSFFRGYRPAALWRKDEMSRNNL
jgi:hypothetical protein